MSTPASVVNSRSSAPSAAAAFDEPRPVHVEHHAALVRVIGDRPHLVDGVHGAELGGLRDAHRQRLRAVLVAPAPRLPVDQLRGELAVR